MAQGTKNQTQGDVATITGTTVVVAPAPCTPAQWRASVATLAGLVGGTIKRAEVAEPTVRSAYLRLAAVDAWRESGGDPSEYQFTVRIGDISMTINARNAPAHFPPAPCKVASGSGKRETYAAVYRAANA